MQSERRLECTTKRTRRRLVAASAIAAVLTAAFLPGSGLGSSATGARGAESEIPAGLAEAIRAHFGAGRMRLASQRVDHPAFGGRISISADGTTALVSAIGRHNYRGAVYVYHVADGGSWTSSSTPTATLTGAGGAAGDLFGRGLAISADGTTAFVGAPFHDDGSGAVYVFHVSSADAWASTSTPTATLTVGTGNALTVGWSVSPSVDGATLLVGAPYSDDLSGEIFVFHVSSEDAWVSSSFPAATLSNGLDPDFESFLGGVVSMSADGTTALVTDNGAGGGADIFHVASEDGWVSSSSPTATLSNASGDFEDALGGSLALSGDGTTAFVAAPGVNDQTGAVDVFHATGEDAWASSSTPTAILTNGVGADGDYLGSFVRASADGTTAVAGAPGVARLRGALYVFHVADADSWTSTAAPTATLKNSARARRDILGEGLAISGDGATVIGGAQGFNWTTGAADVFHVADESSWLTSSTPTATLTNSALPAPACVVPRLVGKPLWMARYRLAASDCRLGRVRRVHSRLKPGLIVSQSPAPRTHLAPGSKVRVKVSR